MLKLFEVEEFKNFKFTETDNDAAVCRYALGLTVMRQNYEYYKKEDRFFVGFY